MHKLTFFPLGNADCCRIDLENDRKVLFDYANTRDPKKKDDRRCDLPKELKDDLDGPDYYDVVAFTHLDKDHYQRASEFFWLEHARKYQDEGRIKIRTMWVPAAIITEEGVEDEEGRIIQKEARHRFKKGKGIRVFSRPERLRKWCEKNDVKLEDREHLITDAGQTAPEFTTNDDGVEFFVHSPFAKRLNDREVEDRNDDAIVMQATFKVEEVETKVLLMSDVTHEILSDIVEITRDKKERPEKLEWDVSKLSHHCSYRSLGPDKGEDKTEPVENVAWIYEDQGQKHATIISSSKPIPKKGTDEDKDDNPPHRQAAAYYEDVASEHDGEFVVTMEHPKESDPKPIVIEITKSKATVKKRAVAAATVASSTRPPRAG